MAHTQLFPKECMMYSENDPTKLQKTCKITKLTHHFKLHTVDVDKSEVAVVWEPYGDNPSFAWLTQVMCVKWGLGSYSMGSGFDYDDNEQRYIFCLN